MGHKFLVDEEKLSKILGDISAVAPNKIRFFGNDPELWLGEPQENLPFCRTLEKHPKTNQHCVECDRRTNQQGKKHSGAFFTFCHAALLEVHCPVRFEDSYLGYLDMGQFRWKKRTAEDAYFAQLAAEAGEDAARLKKAYNSHPMLNEQGLAGAKMLLEMCVERLCREGVFRIDHRDSIHRVEQYIQENLGGNLTLKSIAAYMYVNPSYLSTMYRRATGQALFQYIQQERVTRSCSLLRTTTKPVAEVAAACGFRDANYFTKVFRREKGLSPREYRKKLLEGELIP